MQASSGRLETNVKVVQVLVFYIMTVFLALWDVKWQWAALSGWIWPGALVVALLTLLIHPLGAAQERAKSVWAGASLSALRWLVVLGPMFTLRDLAGGEGFGLPMIFGLLAMFLILMMFSVMGSKLGKRWPWMKDWL